MIKLIAIDVDGTLVTPLKRLTKKNKAAIKRAKDHGLTITLVSGRPFTGLYPLLEELELTGVNSYSVCQNGSYIFDNKDQKPIESMGQGPNELITVDKMLDGYKLELAAMDDFGFYTRHKNPSIFTKIDAKISNIDLKVVAYEDWPADNVFGRYLILGRPSEIKRFIKNMPDGLKNSYYPVQTSPFMIEVMNKSANKGVAIEKLAEKLGVGVDEVMAIGNEKNDIPMLARAGFSVAMANAVREVKDEADFITKNNLRSGVGHAIDRLIDNDLKPYK